MRRGLAQIDLNLKARLALLGLSDTPERDIAELMASNQPIELETRQGMAAALLGKDHGMGLRLESKKSTLMLRRFLVKRKRLALGRAVEQQIAELGYNTAIEKAMALQQLGRKTVEALVTESRRADAWIARLKRQNRTEGFTVETLELAYLYAALTKQKPEQFLIATLSAFSELVDRLDDLQTQVGGLR